MTDDTEELLALIGSLIDRGELVPIYDDDGDGHRDWGGLRASKAARSELRAWLQATPSQPGGGQITND